MKPAELLALTGRLAPLIRSKRPRPVKVIDSSGKLVRIIDDAVLNERLLERAGVEVSLSEEAKRLFCKDCPWLTRKRLGPRNKKGLCRSCAVKRFRAAQSPEHRREISRKASAAVSIEERERRKQMGAKVLKKWNAAMTPEWRREIGRKGNVARWGKTRSK